MSRTLLVVMLGAFVPPLFPSSAPAQGLHVNPTVRDCSIEFDPSLTQADFKTFVAEGTEIASFRPLSGAAPLGRAQLFGGIMYFHAYLDDRKPAWNDTFTRPHDTHYLGDLAGPVLYGGVGLTDALDVGAYFTTNPLANYAFVGGSLRYGWLRESARAPAASVTVNYATVLRVDDVRLNMYAIDLATSKRLGAFAPYFGVRASLSHAAETSPNVNLETVSVLGGQAIGGVHFHYVFLDLAGEAALGRLFTWSLKVGLNPGSESKEREPEHD